MTGKDKQAFEISAICLLVVIGVILFAIGVRLKKIDIDLEHPTIATNATNHITVNAGGHLWLYDGGKYDIKAEPGAIIHDNGG